MPIPVEPAVISLLINNSASETNLPVYVPWKRCKLSYIYGIVTTVIDNTADLEIDFELNAASGTEMMTMTVTKNSAVGTVFEATVSNADACKNLSSDNTSRDAVNVEVDGSSTGTGQMMLYMYFEAYAGE